MYAQGALDRDAAQLQSEIAPETEAANHRRVLIINTRRTARPHDTNTTASQDRREFEAMLARNDDLRKEGIPHFTVRHLSILRQSADQTTMDWTRLAALIESEYHNYHGFVVWHGTDTMVFAASALSFMLENLNKPVVFTGSVITEYRIHSDMNRNIVLALLFAKSDMIGEVCILFAEKLFRANRTIKVAQSQLQPFTSPHFPPLAIVRGSEVDLNWRGLRAAPHSRLLVHGDMTAPILTIKLVPGMSHEIVVRMMHATKARAVVLCAFGSGNVPNNDSIRELVRFCQARDVILTVCSQLRGGRVGRRHFPTEIDLQQAAHFCNR